MFTCITKFAPKSPKITLNTNVYHYNTLVGHISAFTIVGIFITCMHFNIYKCLDQFYLLLIGKNINAKDGDADAIKP